MPPVVEKPQISRLSTVWSGELDLKFIAQTSGNLNMSLAGKWTRMEDVFPIEGTPFW